MKPYLIAAAIIIVIGCWFYMGAEQEKYQRKQQAIERFLRN